MQKISFFKVLLALLIVCYSLVAQSFNDGKLHIERITKGIDTIQIIAESDSLFIKGKYLYEIQDYKTSIDYFLKSDSVIKVHFGQNTPYFGYGKMWASCCYHKLGLDSIAIKYSNYSDKQPIDKLLTHTSDSIVWIALKMIELGQTQNAAEKLFEAATLEKQELGSNSYWYANTLSNCAGLYSEIGNFEKAIELGKEAVAIYRETFGKEHLNYSTCLNNLALCYANSGNFFIAIQLCEEALEIKKRILGTNHPDYVSDLGNLAEYYSAIGNYSEALLLGEKVKNIRKMTLGTEHPDYALSLLCLANYYSAVGKFSEALWLGTESVYIYKNIFGSTHPFYATSLFYLATYYNEVGDYQKALLLGTEAMEIRKQVLGVEHPQYNTSLNNVAVYNSNLGNFTEALKIGNEVTKVAKKIYGTEHPEYATRLFNLANYYSDQGNYIQAIRLCNMAMDILYKAFGSEHPYYAAVLSHLANCNAILGRYKKALYFGKKAMEIRQKIYGSEHPKYGFSLIDLACLYISTGDYVEAHNYLKQYIDYSQSYILNNFIELSSNLRKSLWTKEYASFYINVFPGFVEKYKNKESISELYNKTCLFAKGILLNTDMEIRNLILESSDSLLISKYNHLYSNLCIYNKLLEIPINKRLLNADSLNNVIQSQEMELAKESKVYGDYTHNLTINWKDVQRRLGDNDIAIEFLDFPIYGTDSTMYVALTLKKDYDSPHMVTLFEEKQLKSIPENAYYTQTDASDLIWKPLEEELRGVRNIYFAPSGELHRIGIEYLLINKTKTIGDVYMLHRLSSTRQLAVIQDKTRGEKSILYGGINYDEKTNTVTTDTVSTKESVLRSAYICRANVDSLSLRNSYDYLEGTKREADLIAEDMKSHSVPYYYYSGSEGTEESFKKLDGTRPKVMHIATHGFYFTEEEHVKSLFTRSEMDLLNDGGLQAGWMVEQKPMNRSGLLFSGCNRTIHQEKFPDEEEDGILTAQEISTLDLRGLDLVVLSACQTGLGDIISGEGVFGLQRGFKKAGAKTIIMSLWNVNDESTMKMMSSFYHHYLEGMSKEKAFHTAQDELRKDSLSQQERPDWAAFILLDGIN